MRLTSTPSPTATPFSALPPNRSVRPAKKPRTGGAIATNGARARVEDSAFECNSSDIEGGNVLSDGNTMLGC
jgi:hypothetical protein